MSENNSSGTFGIGGFFGVFFLILLTLKLAKIGVMANASWWVVTSPLWVGWLIIPICLLIFSFFMFYFLGGE